MVGEDGVSSRHWPWMWILAEQISKAFRGGSWHGPSVLEVLQGVSAEDAAAQGAA